MDISDADPSDRGDSFMLTAGEHTHAFERSAFDGPKDEYFYSLFRK